MRVILLLKMVISEFESKIIENKKLNSSVFSLKFSLPKNFSFFPGQYLSVSRITNGKKIRTPYTIASVPNKRYAEFIIKVVNIGKASHYLSKLKRGDKIELFGPIGKFTINNTSKENDLVFISSGTGISPFASMIPYLLEKGFKNKIILLNGFRNEKEILLNKEFLKLSKKYKNFEFHNILSQPLKNFNDKGYVQDFLDKYVPDGFNGDYYLCGLKEMIEEVSKQLENKGVNKNRIFFEKYD